MKGKPDLGPINKLTWCIDGKDISIGSIMLEAQSRGVKLDRTTVRRRLDAGMTTMDEILRPASEYHQKMATKAHSDKKAEMAAFLKTIPPRRRY